MNDEREKALNEAMLLRLWDSDVELKHAAEAEGMSLWDMAQWARKRANKDAAAGLRVWANMATEMMLSRHRISAVARLLEIAMKEQGETARKACVDAIRLNVVPREWGYEREMGGDGAATQPYDNGALIAELESRGIGVFDQMVIADQTYSTRKVLTRFGMPGEAL